jgi:hypothetical protein
VLADSAKAAGVAHRSIARSRADALTTCPRMHAWYQRPLPTRHCHLHLRPH